MKFQGGIGKRKNHVNSPWKSKDTTLSFSPKWSKLYNNDIIFVTFPVSNVIIFKKIQKIPH